MHKDEIKAEKEEAARALEKELGWKFSKIWGDFPEGDHYVENYISCWCSMHEKKYKFQFCTEWIHGEGIITTDTTDIDASLFPSLRRFAGEYPLDSIVWDNMNIQLDKGVNCWYYYEDRNRIITQLKEERRLKLEKHYNKKIQNLNWDILRWDSEKNGWLTEERDYYLHRMDAFIPWACLAPSYTLKAEHIIKDYNKGTDKKDKPPAASKTGSGETAVDKAADKKSAIFKSTGSEKKVETIYCGDCGSQNSSDDIFCSDCGARLD